MSESTEKKRLPWVGFADTHRHWLRCGFGADDILDDESSEEESGTEEVVEFFLYSLSPNPERSLSKGKDFHVITKALSGIWEAMEESILSESEANALVKFLVSKFVERRFNVILQNTFSPESIHRHMFRGVQGKVR